MDEAEARGARGDLALRDGENLSAVVEVAGPDALPADGADIASPEWAKASAPRYLNYRKTSIYGGTSEVQRNIIASTILGL